MEIYVGIGLIAFIFILPVFFAWFNHRWIDKYFAKRGKKWSWWEQNYI